MNFEMKSLLVIFAVITSLSLGACAKKGAPGSSPQPDAPSQKDRDPASNADGKEAPTAIVARPQTPGRTTGVAEAAREELAKPLPPRCMQVAFTRTIRAGEDLAQQRNLLRLTDLGLESGINEKSLCVRVNGVPVKFRPLLSKTKELKGVILDPIANPKAAITARFCVGKNSCNEGCKVPRDEFMDAIGGADAGQGSWDGNEVEVMGALDGRLKRELEAGSDYELADRWTRAPSEPACLTQAEKSQLARTLANQRK